MNQAYGLWAKLKLEKWKSLWFSGTTEMLGKWNMPTAFARLGRKRIGYQA